jgi:hypothetical protein
MTYRNDRDADLARIAALQHELDVAHREIQLLSRRAPCVEAAIKRPIERPLPGSAPPRRPTRVKAHETVHGGELIRTYELDRTLSIARCEQVLHVVHALLEQPGRVERRGIGARWVGRARQIDLEVSATTMRIVACDSSTRAVTPFYGALVAGLIVAAITVSSAFVILLVGVIASAGYALGVERPAQLDRSRRMFDQVARLVATEPR